MKRTFAYMDSCPGDTGSTLQCSRTDIQPTEKDTAGIKTY